MNGAVHGNLWDAFAARLPKFRAKREGMKRAARDLKAHRKTMRPFTQAADRWARDHEHWVSRRERRMTLHHMRKRQFKAAAIARRVGAQKRQEKSA